MSDAIGAKGANGSGTPRHKMRHSEGVGRSPSVHACLIPPWWVRSADGWIVMPEPAGEAAR